MNTTTIAKKYLAHGFSPIPLIDGEKRPSIRNWQQYGEEPMGLKEAESLFQNTGSIGLVMGFDGIDELLSSCGVATEQGRVVEALRDVREGDRSAGAVPQHSAHSSMRRTRSSCCTSSYNAWP